MKGYEDICAGLMLLVVILIGGYVYLNSEVYKQRQVLQIPEKRIELKENKQTFESSVKITQ